MSNWLEHVKKTMKLHPGKPLKEVLKAAKATYKKAEGVAKYAVTGKKSRKHHKKSHKGRKRKAKTAKRASRKSRRSRRSRK
jgi:hypothetical protein